MADQEILAGPEETAENSGTLVAIQPEWRWAVE